ncbi:unnamed protein product [Schistocephalus solidus]|uniref:Uncharacterized protein n=1 Tax=Schistocephalus solidus TaxID=70667 RepID=A0A183T968_SCHSO|nr:unnamed protein product [Schistocephalus solidus]
MSGVLLLLPVLETSTGEEGNEHHMKRNHAACQGKHKRPRVDEDEGVEDIARQHSGDTEGVEKDSEGGAHLTRQPGVTTDAKHISDEDQTDDEKSSAEQNHRNELHQVKQTDGEEITAVPVGQGQRGYA